MRPEPYEAAVLFVHGIGEQKRGETLAGFGGSLAASARAWFGAANVVDVSSGAGLRDGAPEHRELLMTRPGREPQRVLLAESMWADKVHAPRWWDLMRWLSGTVPFVVQRAADAGMRRSSRKIDDAAVRLPDTAYFAAKRVVQNVLAVAFTAVVLSLLLALGLLALAGPIRKRLFGDDPRAFPVWAQVLAGVALVPIVVLMPDAGPLARTGLGLVGVFPVVVLLSLSQQLRSLVVGFIGDSYALLTDDEAQRAIVGQVRHDLAWLERCAAGAPVVIIAHSQGAEVARRVLLGREAPVASLVTFGSGIAKLHAVGKLRGQRGRSWGAFALRGLSAACTCAAAVALLGLWDAASRPYVVIALLALAMLALSAARKQLQRIVGAGCDADALQIGRRQVAHWTDLHASSDPVSEGDLPVGECTRGTSRTIVNRRSLLLDHVTYWSNVEGFQAAVALEIERAADGLDDARQPAELQLAEGERTRYFDVIYNARAAAVALGVTLWVAFDHELLAGAVIAATVAVLFVAVSKALTALAAARTRARMGAAHAQKKGVRRAPASAAA